jgi:hypothetical protein
MKNINDKKYSVLLFLFGLFSSVICNIIATKYYYFGGDYFLVADVPQLKTQNFEVVKLVDFFALSVKLNSVLVFCIMLIALSIYTFLYKTDAELISILSNLKGKTTSIRLKLNDLKTKRVSKKTDSKVTLNAKIQIEKSEDQIKFGKIQALKSNGLLFGFIILVIQIALYLLLRKYVVEYSIQIIINFSISIILRFFSAYKCNQLSEYNKGSSNMWFLFGIMLPSIALIIAGMDFSIKKEWEDYQNIASTHSELKTNKSSISRYTIFLLIIILILVTILCFKNSKLFKKQDENNAPELINSSNIYPIANDTNTAVAPDTTILNQLNKEELEKENAISKEDSILGEKFRKRLLNTK